MKFSVIIPLYNKAPYVAKAIGSVLKQTFTDYELIIMDDGSKDDSFEVARKAIQGYNRCHLYKQMNAGVSMARNNAVALSQSDYLCFLDADDWWDPDFLLEMSKLIEEFPDAGIYGVGYTIVNETKHNTRVAPIGLEPGFKRGFINYCKVYSKTNTDIAPLIIGSVSVPRPVFETMKGFTKGVKLGEDFILWIHIALNYKVAFFNKPLAYYNQDVDLENRGVGKLYNPKEHMLWNLTDLEPLEKENMDYKRLVDELRVTSMMPYFLSNYREEAKRELLKVDWSMQSSTVLKEFQKPVLCLKLKYDLLKFGSRVKLKLFKTIRNGR